MEDVDGYFESIDGLEGSKDLELSQFRTIERSGSGRYLTDRKLDTNDLCIDSYFEGDVGAIYNEDAVKGSSLATSDFAVEPSNFFTNLNSIVSNNIQKSSNYFSDSESGFETDDLNEASGYICNEGALEISQQLDSESDSSDDNILDSQSLFNEDPEVVMVALLESISKFGPIKFIEKSSPTFKLLFKNYLDDYKHGETTFRTSMDTMSDIPRYEDFRWTYEFNTALKNNDEVAMAHVFNDFASTARLYARVLISEKYMPYHRKSIKPVDAGGVAGGLKYIVAGIFFKFPSDIMNKKTGRYMYSKTTTPDDYMALKAIGNERRALNALISVIKKYNIDINVPLVCLVDFMGFRLFACSLLPISGVKSLVYGSCDGAVTVRDGKYDTQTQNVANSISKGLYLDDHPIKSCMGIHNISVPFK